VAYCTPGRLTVEPSRSTVKVPVAGTATWKLPPASVTPSVVEGFQPYRMLTPARGRSASSRTCPARRVWPGAWTWRRRGAVRVTETPLSRVVPWTVMA